MATPQQWPDVKRVGIADLVDVVAAGLRDFAAAPGFGLLLSGLYVVVGWTIMALLWVFKILYVAYPLAMAFALVAPFAAVGFYAVSAELEADRKVTWSGVWARVMAAARRDLRWMALVTGFALVIWMDIAAFLFFAFMGVNGFGPDALSTLFTTPGGLLFVALGNISGAIIALFVFSISVVSFPMLYDRDVDFVTAMVTSVRLVIANPVTMVLWCAFIGILTVLSILSAFIGFLVVLPVIGHASWHLYRRGVEPAAAAGEIAATAA